MAFYTPEELEALESGASGGQFYTPEEFDALSTPQLTPAPIATRSSEQAGIVRAPQTAPVSSGPGLLEATRAKVGGAPLPHPPSLPVDIGAEIIANLPMELGAAGGMARGAALGSRLGPYGAGAGAVLGGLGGAGTGLLAQEGFKAALGNPLARFDPAGGVSNMLWTVAGGLGAPLVQQGLGRLVDRFTNRVPAPPTGLPTQLSPEQRAAARGRADLSQEFGVPYTYGELTQDYDLMGREATLRALPGSADPMENFLRERAVRTQGAAQGVAESISPVAPAEAFARAGESAADALKGLKRKRSVDAGRLYQKVWDQKLRVPVGDIVEDLTRAGANEEAGIQKVYNATIDDIRKRTAEDGTVDAQVLHNIQRRLGSKAQTIEDDAVLRETNRSIGLTLKNRLEGLSPDYRAASDRYRELSRPIELVETATRLGRTAKRDPVEFSTEVAGWFRGNNAAGPEDIRNIKNVWRRTLPADRYRNVMDGLRSTYIRSALDTIRPTEGSGPLNVAGKLARALGGDPSEAGGLRTRQMLQELYTPTQLGKIDRFLRLLDDTSRITAYGSPTQPRQVAARMRAAGDDLPPRTAFRDTGPAAWVADMLYDRGRNFARRRLGMEQREMAANTAYAEALNSVADASVRHLDRLDRALQQAPRLRPERAQSEITRAFGALLGGGTGAELQRRAEPMAALFGGA